MIKYLNNFMIGYLSGAIPLLIMFLITMKFHQGTFDLEHTFNVVGHHFWFALPSGILCAIGHKYNVFLKCIFGVLVSCLIATGYIHLL